ncbi:MAG: glutamyl-tRNA reductase [Candidatus Caenarcaniphilales bacterium]|nr:glutamyl-tRNA reductase [Candidatus Caenarcaniphilales bacterium]
MNSKIEKLRDLSLDINDSICLIGLNYKTSPIEVRERFSLSAEGQSSLYQILQESGLASLILDTCNRTEIYLSGDDLTLAQIKTLVMQIWSEAKGFDSTLVAEHTSFLEDREAVMHFFRVVSGLESMILGEGQILHQVKLSYLKAQNFTNATLNQMVQRALAAGKKVRTHTEISRGAMSVPAAALQLIQQRLAPIELRDSKIMVLGSGQVAELCLEFLRSQGAADKLTLVARSESLNKLSHHRVSELIEYEDLFLHAPQQDVIIVCTSAPKYVLEPKHLVNLHSSLLVCDLSLPRNVDPHLRNFPNVNLIDLDFLKRMVEQNHSQRANQIIKAEYIIAGEIKKFDQWRQKASLNQLKNLSQ